MSKPGTVDQPEQDVVFRLGGENYGVDIARVHEIIRLRKVTPTTSSLPNVVGTVEIRGSAVPVLDFRESFGVDTRLSAETSRIIVLTEGPGLVGLIVDEVREVVTVREGLRPAPLLQFGMARAA